MNEFLQYLYEHSKTISIRALYFLYRLRNRELNWKLFEKIVARYAVLMDVLLTPVPEKVTDQNTSFVLIGEYSKESIARVLMRHPDLKEHIYTLGIVNDILSYLELFDLYLNPVRRGGGTSAVEAMAKGLPVVTTAFGDVAVNAGDEFLTESYETMPELIERYKTDRAFYQKQSELARKRGEELTDNEEEFVQIIRDFLRKNAEQEKTTGLGIEP